MNKNNFVETSYNKPFIIQRADPYIYKHIDGSYYFTASVPEYDRIVLRHSDTMIGLKDAEEVTIWRKHKSGIMSVHIWAPELHYLDNKWFIYYAAGDIDDIWAIRPYVLECEGQDPVNDSWKELGLVKRNDDFSFNDFSLDMTVFENKGKIFLTYSASETGECYCMGMLSIDENKNLLNPHEWKKEYKPILNTDIDKQIYGPGHNSFVKDENGNDIMIYHARQYNEIIGDPLYDHNRHAYRMKIIWDIEGNPVFDYENNF